MRMYVGGEWTDGARQEELRSPYSGEVIDTVPVGTLEDVERALASAVRGAAAPAPHDRSRARGDPAPRGRPRGRASRGPGGDDLARERQGDRGGPRRGGPRRRSAAALRLRGHPALRRQPAARRGRRRRPAPPRLHAAPAVWRRGRHHAVQLSAAAGLAQDRARACRRQRRRAQAGPPDAADGPEARRDPARGRARAGGHLVPHRPGRRARERARERSARAQDQLHRQHRDRRRDRPQRGREEAVARAGRELPGRDPARRRHRARGPGGRARRLRQRRAGLHLGPARAG